MKLKGKLKRNSVSVRQKARFPIPSWNLFDRVKNRKPLTNNNVENWHCRVTQDIRKNMTVNICVELFRLEQNKMEGDLVRVMSGEVKKKRTTQEMKDEQIFVLVSSYKKEDLVLFLNSMSLNMGS